MSALTRISQVRLRCGNIFPEKHVNGVQCTAAIRCIHKEELKSHKSPSNKTDPRVAKFREKIIYCDHLDGEKVKNSYVTYMTKRRKEEQTKRYLPTNKMLTSTVFSALISRRTGDSGKEANEPPPEESETETEERKLVHMPYGQTHRVEKSDPTSETHADEPEPFTLNQKYKDMYEAYLKEREAQYKGIVSGGNKKTGENRKDARPRSRRWIRPTDSLSHIPPNWMTDFEEFDDSTIDLVTERIYGTPNVSAKISDVPCGGCGAVLHCRDPALPGYLPSELYTSVTSEHLKAMICQRCHFMKHYNTALDVQVSPDEYTEMLKIIRRKKCAVILMVDLTDFPCSIWPGIAEVLHPLTPVFLVGNKIDALPPDSPNFFAKVKAYLHDYVEKFTQIKPEMIVHTQLISAKTGFGVESLISSLQHKWRHKGDVYLIGCTNVGKSSLFNALLQSDYCKVQAVDLVQRATVSPWPGTTINLLKFPILNPTNQKIALRLQRLEETREAQGAEQQYKRGMFERTGKLKYASLTGIIDYTFYSKAMRNPEVDPFSEKSQNAYTAKFGLDETRPEYSQSRWCYDTPGTVQYDQVIDLLTTEELLLTLPDEMISPRTFRLFPQQTVFLAGLGRLDYLEGNAYIRCTLFASRHLPLTICQTIDADSLYESLLETKAFVVPTNNFNRLESWPGLGSKDFTVFSSSQYESVADVVLSSIGWIAITAQTQETVALRAWTPQARGLHLRKPALLENTVNLHGKRVPYTPLYRKGKQICIQ